MKIAGYGYLDGVIEKAELCLCAPIYPTNLISWSLKTSPPGCSAARSALPKITCQERRTNESMLTKKIKEYFKDKTEVVAVYLFGSHADGKDIHPVILNFASEQLVKQIFLK